MKKIKLILTTLAVFAVAFMATAQNITVSGTVVDQDGQPVIAAAVQVEGTNSGTVTDASGAYSISASAKGKLIFSALGYETVTIAINSKKTVNAVLNEDSKYLDEVVVVGYGSAKKVGSIVGSVTTVKAEAIKNTPTQSALDKLQGQVAGLSVMTTGGVAGDNSVSMTLHGTASLSAGSQPLYIIDGIPSSAKSIMGMNPNDIASISVLKDASATSIYGAQAANGVVYITTKSGTYNSDATVTIRGQYGVSTLADWSQYTNMMSGPELADFWLRSGLMTPDAFKKNYVDKGYTHDTKWYKYFQNEWTHQNQTEVTIEGGSKNLAYMAGFSQYHQQGTSIGNYYDRYTLSSNIQGHPKSWLKFGLKMNLYITERQQNGNWDDSSQSQDNNYVSGMISEIWNPLYPATDENGEVFTGNFPMGGYNQHEYYKYNKDIYRDYGLMGSAFVNIELIKNLFLQSRIGTDSYIELNDWTYLPSYYQNKGKGTRGRSSALYYKNTITNTIEYKLNLKDLHEFNILLGQEGIDYSGDYFYASARELTDDRLMMLQNGSTETRKISESYSAYRFLSFFGHADYSFANKYIIDVTLRNDASSRFGSNNRNALFWAVGGMWKIKKESFLKNVNWIDNLNLKVSYGTQGNAAFSSNYAHLGLIGSSSAYNGSTGKVLSQPANPDLTWEQQALFTVGVNGRMFNRFDFNIEYYHRKTSNMLMSVPFPYTAGFTSMYSNVGGMLNQGVDITLGVDILQGRDYYLRFDTTFGYNKEQITELFNGEKRWTIANSGVAYVVGNSINYYEPIYAGIDPADGKMMWYLPGEDIDVTTMDPTRTTKVFDSKALEQNTGRPVNAPVYGGFSLSGSWKGLSCRADFSYVIGKYLINWNGFFDANPNLVGTSYNQRKDVTDFWTPYNTDAKYPNWATGVTMESDTHLLEDASFLRLKSLQIGYSIKQFLGWQKAFSDIRVNFTGRNLLTFTNFSGIDPEVDSNLSVGIPGNTKQFLFGFELTF